MNYWWAVVLAVILLSEDLRYSITNVLNGLGTPMLFVLFLLAVVWWSRTS